MALEVSVSNQAQWSPTEAERWQSSESYLLGYILHHGTEVTYDFKYGAS